MEPTIVTSAGNGLASSCSNRYNVFTLGFLGSSFSPSHRARGASLSPGQGTWMMLWDKHAWVWKGRIYPTSWAALLIIKQHRTIHQCIISRNPQSFQHGFRIIRAFTSESHFDVGGRKVVCVFVCMCTCAYDGTYMYSYTWRTEVEDNILPPLY